MLYYQYLAFIEKHSTAEKQPISNGRGDLLCFDGAHVRQEGCICFEPSEIPTERLSAIRDFHRAHAEALQQERCRLSSLGQLPGAGTPMNALAISIAAHRRAVARVEKELETIREQTPEAAANLALARIRDQQFSDSIGPLQAELKRREQERAEDIACQQANSFAAAMPAVTAATTCFPGE